MYESEGNTSARSTGPQGLRFPHQKQRWVIIRFLQPFPSPKAATDIYSLLTNIFNDIIDGYLFASYKSLSDIIDWYLFYFYSGGFV